MCKPVVDWAMNLAIGLLIAAVSAWAIYLIAVDPIHQLLDEFAASMADLLHLGC